MIAYLAAQLCDVYLFHFWRRLTRGRHHIAAQGLDLVFQRLRLAAQGLRLGPVLLQRLLDVDQAAFLGLGAGPG